MSAANEWSPLAGRNRCCDLDFGGSHYHCAECNGVTGMYGHYKGGEFHGNKWIEFAERHFCCPGKCENPAAHKEKS